MVVDAGTSRVPLHVCATLVTQGYIVKHVRIHVVNPTIFKSRCVFDCPNMILRSAQSIYVEALSPWPGVHNKLSNITNLVHSLH